MATKQSDTHNHQEAQAKASSHAPEQTSVGPSALPLVVVSSSLDSLPGHPTAQGLRQATVMRMQRRYGNAYVQRVMSSRQAHHAGSGLVQRDTSEELEEDTTVQRQAAPAGMIQRADLSDNLSDAMSGLGTDEDAIFAAIAAAPANEKQAVLNNPVIMADLRDELSAEETLRAYEGLGAPLTRLLPVAIEAGSSHVTRVINAAPLDQKQAVLREPALVTSLRSELSSSEAIEALKALGASLTECLYAAMEGWGTDEAAILELARNAPPEQRQAALHDRALIARLKDELTREEMLQTLEQLGASIIDRLNTAMEGWGVDSATILSISGRATEDEKRQVLGDSALMARLRGELSQADMQTVLANIGGSLVDRLNLAMEGWGTDEQTILTIIPAASEAERMAAHDDTAFIARLKSELSDEEYWQARLLLRFGSQANIDAASAQVPAVSNGVYYRCDVHIRDSEWEAALATMRNHLETTGAIDSSQYSEMVYDAGGSGEGLTTVDGYDHDAAAGTWTVTSTPRVTVHPAGFADPGWLYSTILHEYQHVLQFNAGYNADPNSAVVIAADEVQAYLWEIENAGQSGLINNSVQMNDVGGRLTTHFNRLDAAHKATYQARYDAAIAVVAAVPAAAGGAAAPPQSLTAKLSTELQNSPPDTAKMLADITAATADEREPVRRNTDLMQRLNGAFSQADMRQVLTLLGSTFVDRLNLLLDQAATAADILALVNSGTADDKQSVLNNAALVARLLEHLETADELTVMQALGDNLGNLIDRALAATPVAEESIYTLIRAADAAKRQEVGLNVELMNRLRAALTAYNYWKVRLLLQYGSEGAFPPGVTIVFNAFAGAPSFADIRRTLANLNAADYAVVKDLVGIRDILRALLTDDANYTFVLRMLDQGLITEETDVSSAMSETLQTGNPATGPFSPRVFSWNTGFDIAYLRDALQLTVRIKLDPTNATARTQLATAQPVWESNIEGAWNNQFRVTNAIHTLPLRFNCHFTDSDPHHTVNVHPGVPSGWPGVDMLNWYTGRLVSPNHEFGHMLGNPDEYFLSQAHYTAVTGENPTTAPAGAVTTETDTAGNQRFSNQVGIMGVSSQPVQQRHMNFFLNWINSNRRTNADGTFAEPAFTLTR